MWRLPPVSATPTVKVERMPFPYEPKPAPGRPGLDSRNEAIRDLQRALLRFGQEFGLLEGATCDCDNPHCSNRQVETMTVERLLDWVSDAWHAQAGCGHDEDGEPTASIELQRLRERNLNLVGHFADLLSELPDADWRRLGDRFATMGDAPLFREADALIAHGLETMMPGYEEEYWPTHAVAVAEEWTEEQSEAPINAQRIVDATRCAVCALLADGLAERRLTDALYEPFAPVVPLNELILSARRDRPAR
jgi:hypothetical protein